MDPSTLPSATIDITALHPGRNTVYFPCASDTLAGHLYLPSDFDPQHSYSTLVVNGSLTSVKEQMSGIYAGHLAEQGFVALAFDYRNYGQSTGEPRQFEQPDKKRQDWEAAVSFLLSLPFVKVVGALGVCTSGGTVAYVAAHDRRVKAVATVAAWLAEPVLVAGMYGGQAHVDELLQQAVEAKQAYEKTGIDETILAYSNTDKTASHFGPMEYYMDQTRGGGVPEWTNAFAVMSWPEWFGFDPISKAPLISTPYLMVHLDDCALPEQAKKFFGQLTGEKELVWTKGYHFDFYDEPAHVQKAVQKITEFMRLNLS